MAESFNLNTFLNEYKSYNNRQYTSAENGKEAMEARDIARAEEAVNGNLLKITLGEKFKEMGVGPKVMQQIADTAENALKGIVSPLTDYLDKYENIFDQNVYNAEIQSYAKQMFFANQALSYDASSKLIAQKFIMNM